MPRDTRPKRLLERDERVYRHAFLQIGTHQVDVIDDHSATGSGVCFTRAWSGRSDARGCSDTMVVHVGPDKQTDDRRWNDRRRTHGAEGGS